MTKLTVALLQMESAGFDQEANLAKGETFCRRAAALGADIALFPEMWNIGYRSFATGEGGPVWRSPASWLDGQPPREPIEAHGREAWQAQAIDGSGPFVSHFRGLARELGLAIALTYLERWEPAPRNVVSLIDGTGEVLFTYAKVHTCVWDEPEASTTPGDRFRVATLQTAAGPVKVGAMICHDREQPESARILMLKGAEIVLTPNACELEPARIAQFKTRAFENMLGVALANYAAPEQNGHSCAFHPVAHGPRGRVRDTLVVEAGEAEGIYPATFDLADIRAWRERAIWGNAFRRPQRYRRLVEPEVEEPFVRVDAAGRPFAAARVT